MTKIYLSPSSQPNNKYAYGNTDEQTQCRKIANACEAALKRCGFEVKNGQTGDHISRTKESNAWKADLHLAIHTNAFNGLVRGTRMFYFNPTGNSYKACKAIYDILAKNSPGTSDNMTMNQDLYEVQYTNCSPVYIEVSFHDNIHDAKWIVDNTTQIGEWIAQGVCNYYGVKYIASGINSDSKMCRVICGSFKDRGNAEKRQKELKAKGFDSFIEIK